MEKMWKNKDGSIKGIWQQMDEMFNQPPAEPVPFTLETLKEYFEEAFNKPFQKHKLRLPCSDYPNFTDEQFINFIEGCKNSEYYDYHFIGGSEGYSKMKARMDRLNIKLD